MDRKQVAVFHTCAGRRINETLARCVGARVCGYRRRYVVDDRRQRLPDHPPVRSDLTGCAVGRDARPDGFDADVRAGIRSSHMPAPFPVRREHRSVGARRAAGGRYAANASWNSGHPRPGRQTRPRVRSCARPGARSRTCSTSRVRSRMSRCSTASRASWSAGSLAVHLRYRHLVVRRRGRDGRSRDHGRGVARPGAPLGEATCASSTTNRRSWTALLVSVARPSPRPTRSRARRASARSTVPQTATDRGRHHLGYEDVIGSVAALVDPRRPRPPSVGDRSPRRLRTGAARRRRPLDRDERAARTVGRRSRAPFALSGRRHRRHHEGRSRGRDLLAGERANGWNATAGCCRTETCRRSNRLGASSVTCIRA